ncbi:MAG: hypothetical protein PHO83_14820 [Geobacteraceae bacterium]|nr:hypothetical protein [Geobacteraceae bacterium]
MNHKIKHQALLKSIFTGNEVRLSSEIKKLIENAFRRGFHAGLNAQQERKKRMPLVASRSYKKNGFLCHVDDSGNVALRRMVRRPSIPDFSDPEYFGVNMITKGNTLLKPV